MWEFIKCTVQTLNAQLLQRFTDHQRVGVAPLQIDRVNGVEGSGKEVLKGKGGGIIGDMNAHGGVN